MLYNMKAPYTNNKGTVVRGNAATNHWISEFGGIEKFIQFVETNAIHEYNTQRESNRLWYLIRRSRRIARRLLNK